MFLCFKSLPWWAFSSRFSLGQVMAIDLFLSFVCWTFSSWFVPWLSDGQGPFPLVFLLAKWWSWTFLSRLFSGSHDGHRPFPLGFSVGPFLLGLALGQVMVMDLFLLFVGQVVLPLGQQSVYPKFWGFALHGWAEGSWWFLHGRGGISEGNRGFSLPSCFPRAWIPLILWFFWVGKVENRHGTGLSFWANPLVLY